MKQSNKIEFIDLDLPSGLKWAKCNVGAEKETDYGDYFQWGLTTPNTADDCTLESYRYCNGSDITLTKYNNISFFGTVDNITTLKTTDDTATQIMGSEWRMPTKDDFQELLDNTDSEWTQVNGVNGRKFTSKTDTSRYIFIPAAGYCGYGSVHYVGNYGGVWSSLLHTIYPYSACGLGFNLYNCYMGNNYRYGGRSVRGVRK